MEQQPIIPRIVFSVIYATFMVVILNAAGSHKLGLSDWFIIGLNICLAFILYDQLFMRFWRQLPPFYGNDGIFMMIRRRYRKW